MKNTKRESMVLVWTGIDGRMHTREVRVYRGPNLNTVEMPIKRFYKYLADNGILCVNFTYFTDRYGWHFANAETFKDRIIFHSF
jgi:hypothetical protein